MPCASASWKWNNNLNHCFILGNTSCLTRSLVKELAAAALLRCAVRWPRPCGLSGKASAQIAEAMTSPSRPPVIWIGAQECTGCTESLLRATHPTVENLVLDVISLEYHEAGDATAIRTRTHVDRDEARYLLGLDRPMLHRLAERSALQRHDALVAMRPGSGKTQFR